MIAVDALIAGGFLWFGTYAYRTYRDRWKRHCMYGTPGYDDPCPYKVVATFKRNNVRLAACSKHNFALMKDVEHDHWESYIAGRQD